MCSTLEMTAKIMHQIFSILNPQLFYFLDSPQACFTFLKINDKISQCLVHCLNHMLIMYNNQNATMDFCPRDSGPMFLHYAYRQILTYALKVIKMSTFDYFYPNYSPKADGKVWGFPVFRIKILKSTRLYNLQSVCSYLSIGLMQDHISTDVYRNVLV